jgi:hypothetical protein
MKTNIETEFTHDQQEYILELHNEMDSKNETIAKLLIGLYFVAFWAVSVTLVLIFKPEE